jgi:hypothetical protein
LYHTGTIIVPPGFASESGTELRASFADASTPPFGTTETFVQLVIPDAGQVAFAGEVVTTTGTPTTHVIVGTVPEPSTPALLAVVVAGSTFTRHRRAAARNARTRGECARTR